jgi:hypothetical protein
LSLPLPPLPYIRSSHSFPISTQLIMAHIQTRAQHLATQRAKSLPVCSAARRACSVTSSPPCPIARRAKKASSASVMALGAKKSPASSGRKAESAPAGASGRTAKHPSSFVSASGPMFLGRRLCLCCAKFVESTPDYRCLFNKDSSKMCARCRVLKNPCLPVSDPVPT